MRNEVQKIPQCGNFKFARKRPEEDELGRRLLRTHYSPWHPVLINFMCTEARHRNMFNSSLLPPRNICRSAVNTMGTHSSGGCDPSLILSPTAEEVWATDVPSDPGVFLRHAEYFQSPRLPLPSPGSPQAAWQGGAALRLSTRCSLSRAAHTFLSLWFHSPFITAHAPHAPLCHFGKIKKSLFTHGGQKWAAPNRICLQTESLSQGQAHSRRYLEKLDKSSLKTFSLTLTNNLSHSPNWPITII